VSAIYMLVYFVLGTVQFFAVMAGMQALGIPWILSAFAAVFVAYTPLVGTAAGVYGAVTAWGWSLTQALAVFLGPLAVMALAATAVAAWGRRDRRPS
jgi:hypothetical protein